MMMHRNRLAWPLLLGVGFSMLVWAVVGAPAAAADSVAPGAVRVYVGTYTAGTKSRGIYLLDLDLAQGKLASQGVAAEISNPSFVALHPNGKFLYSVSEIDDYHGQRAGGVSAFAIRAEDGRLALINQQSSRGAGPCQLVVDPSGRCVLVANYGGGSIAVLPLESDGRLREASTFIQHAGSSVNPQRQEGPHAHSINVDPSGRRAFVCDLGLDKIFIYQFDAARGKLTAHDPPFAAVDPGSGPRHLALHPGGRFAYVINELRSTVTALAYDAARGSLTEIQTITTLPAGFRGENTTAEVQVHPSGRFLYGSNRGHDSLAVFAIDQQTGRLTTVGHVSTQGHVPRNFAIDPTGRYLLAANQDSNTVVVFGIDPESGQLSATGSTVQIPAPVCLKMAAAR